MNVTANPTTHPGRILIWGIGCPLLGDQGFGINIVHTLDAHYKFDESVELVDGGLVGVGLFGLLAEADHLIAVDAVRNHGIPGEFYRWEGQEIFERFMGKNHVQQVEFLEALAHCQVLEHSPQAVLLGIEPADAERLVCELTPCLQAAQPAMIERVLAELDRLGVTYQNKKALQPCV